MVKTLNVTLDDNVHERAKRVKNELDLTWPEFIERAADELQEPEPTIPRKEPERPFADRGALEFEEQEETEDTDLVEWVRKNQPVSKAEILEECVPDDYPGKPRSWWDRHGRHELQEAGAEHTRNVGWSID